MRILFATDTYPPQVNGVSVVTALSVQGLAARGWTCAVIAPRYPNDEPDVFTAGEGGGPEAQLTEVPSVPLPIYPDIRLSAPAARTVARAIDAFRPAVVHSATEFVIGRLAQRAARTRGIPTTSSYHTDFAKYTKAYRIGALEGSVRRYIARFHRRSRRIYTPSGPARDDLLRAGLRDVEVWGRGVDVDLFTPAKRDPALRERLGVGDRFVFLHVGRLAREKGVHVILDAYRRALPRLPADGTRLVIAGAGPSADALQADAPPGTVFLGYLDRTRELPALYASTEAFCFASLTETLGLVILEAMAAGLPVIAAPAGGVADHLRDGENGLAYPPSDADAMAERMVRLATTPGLRASLVPAARATAERLTWAAELDRLAASYLEVLQGG
jgi:glycosyltransferase involved in cell wall biosynthesis